MTSRALPTTAGFHSLTLEIEGFGPLRYTLYLPAGFGAENGIRYPFVMALHYGFDRSAPFPAYYGRGVLEGLVLPALETLSAVMVAPDSHGHYWTDADIGMAVDGLGEHLLGELPIDRARTLLTGFSLGGIGTWHLMGQQASRYRAAISVAANPPEAAVAHFPDRPLYVIHSDHDEIFALDSVATAVRTAQARGVDVTFRQIEGITHFNVPGFVPALADSREWLERAWVTQAAR